ncbi:MAG: hypothetical protein EBT92_19095 [Planctomycetes bacterium]|nr:hypothetical protein [Planctomycetota bacterium]
MIKNLLQPIFFLLMCGVSLAGWPDDEVLSALRHLQRHSLERMEVAIVLVKVGDADHRLSVAHCLASQ